MMQDVFHSTVAKKNKQLRTAKNNFTKISDVLARTAASESKAWFALGMLADIRIINYRFNYPFTLQLILFMYFLSSFSQFFYAI